MATERMAGGSGVAGGSARGESLVQIVSLLGTRRRELKAAAGERLLLLEGRENLAEGRRGEIDVRLAGMEAQLELLERARAAALLRLAHRRAGIVRLREQVQKLRERAGSGNSSAEASAARMHGLGSVLMYVGGLLVLWVVLLELGLALGLS